MNRKSKTIIFGILFIILILIGVSFYSLTKIKTPKTSVLQPTPTLKEQKTFEEIIKELNTSQKLINYINKNFKYEPREGNVALSPKKVFEEKKGGSQDLAVFTAYTLYQNGFISFMIRYRYVSNGLKSLKDNYVVEFRDIDLPKYIYFDKNGAHMLHHGWSFEDLCKKEEERLGIKIIKYGILSPLVQDLTPKEWIEINK
jgi:hypothetical protein